MKTWPRELFRRLGDREKVLLEIVVADTGTGLSAQGKDNLFINLDKLDDYEDAGEIGLSISKQLIENTGDSIELKSQEGLGTQIIIHQRIDSIN